MTFERWKEGLSAEMVNALSLFGATWTTEQKKAVTDALKALEGKKRRRSINRK